MKLNNISRFSFHFDGSTFFESTWFSHSQLHNFVQQKSSTVNFCIKSSRFVQPIFTNNESWQFVEIDKLVEFDLYENF